MDVESYLPVWCAACGRVCLEPVQIGLTPRCRSCGAATQILPGEVYVESDLPLFERIEAAIRRLGISRQVAAQAVGELSHPELRAREPETVLLRVVDLLPSLNFLIPALCLQPAHKVERVLLARASGMVLAVVSGRLRELERASAVSLEQRS